MRVIAQVPVDVATYLINEKRDWLRTLEDKTEIELVIVPNPNIQTPEYSIRRMRDDEAELPENRQLSYLMPTPAEVADPMGREKKPAQDIAAVASILPATVAPAASAPPMVSATPDGASESRPVGFWGHVRRWLAGEEASSRAPTTSAPAPAAAPSTSRESTDRATERSSGQDGRSRSRRYGGDGGYRDRDRHRSASRDRGRDRDRDRSGERSADRDRSRDGDRDRTRHGGNRSSRDGGSRPLPAPPAEMSSARKAMSRNRAARPVRPVIRKCAPSLECATSATIVLIVASGADGVAGGVDAAAVADRVNRAPAAQTARVPVTVLASSRAMKSPAASRCRRMCRHRL